MPLHVFMSQAQFSCTLLQGNQQKAPLHRSYFLHYIITAHHGDGNASKTMTVDDEKQSNRRQNVVTSSIDEPREDMARQREMSL